MNSLAGPLGAGWFDYPVSTSMANQLLGLELVPTFLVVPALLGAAVLSWRESPVAPLLGFGPSAYVAYMFVQYVVGPDYVHYTPAPFLHIAIASLGTFVTVRCWSAAAAVPLPTAAGAQRLRRTAWLLFLAAFVLSRYVPALAGAATGARIPREFAGSSAFYWSIVLLDLGAVVPLTLLAAGVVARAGAASTHAHLAVSGWFAFVPPSVAAMAAVMVVKDDPNASVPTLVLLLAASAAFAYPLVPGLRRLATSAARAPARAPDPPETPGAPR